VRSVLGVGNDSQRGVTSSRSKLTKLLLKNLLGWDLPFPHHFT
jgi:hypothetical protein